MPLYVTKGRNANIHKVLQHMQTTYIQHIDICTHTNTHVCIYKYKHTNNGKGLGKHFPKEDILLHSRNIEIYSYFNTIVKYNK